MNSTANKTRLAEKQKTQLQKRKLIRKQTESNREVKQIERRQKKRKFSRRRY